MLLIFFAATYDTLILEIDKPVIFGGHFVEILGFDLEKEGGDMVRPEAGKALEMVGARVDFVDLTGLGAVLNEVLKLLSLADEVMLVFLYQYFWGAQTAVVVGTHGKSVCAGVENGQEIAGLLGGATAVLAPESLPFHKSAQLHPQKLAAHLGGPARAKWGDGHGTTWGESGHSCPRR